MNLYDRFLGFFNPRAALGNLHAREALTEFRYEGAASTRDRQLSSWAGNTTVESSSNARDRIQLMIEARELMQNFPMVKGLFLDLALYSFGTVRWQSRCGQPDLEKLYEDKFSRWSMNCDFSGRFNLMGIIRLAFISMLRDGDVGIVLRYDDGGLKLQLVEADRIGKPHESRLSDNYFSGITIDAVTGRPIQYTVYERTREGQYVNPQPIPARGFIHLFDPMRCDQYRGITALDAAIPTCRDIADMMRYERFAVKWASSNTGVVRRVGGDPDEWKTNTSATGAQLEAVEYGKLNYLNAGEEITPFRTDRPNSTFQAFLEQMQRDVCASIPMPYAFFVNNERLGGQTGRLDSQKACRVCLRYQELIRDYVLERVKDAFFNLEIATNGLTANPNWQSGKWQFPAWPTSDIGYESQANIEENKLGLKTAADIYAERGKDWEEEFEQIAREQVKLDVLAKESGLPIDRLSQRSPNPPVEGEDGAPSTGKTAAKTTARPAPPKKKELTELEEAVSAIQAHLTEFRAYARQPKGSDKGGEFAPKNKGGGRQTESATKRLKAKAQKETDKTKSKAAKESHAAQSSPALRESKNAEKIIARSLGAKVMEMKPEIVGGKPKWNPSDLHVNVGINGRRRKLLGEVKCMGVLGKTPKEIKVTSRLSCRIRKHSESTRLKAPTFTIAVDVRKCKRDGNGNINMSKAVFYVYRGVGSPRLKGKNADAARTTFADLRKKIQQWDTLPFAGNDKENYRFQPK